MKTLCGTILAAAVAIALYDGAADVYADWLSGLADRVGDRPRETRVLQGFPRFQPSE